MTIIHFFNWSQNGSSFFLFSLFSLSLFLSLSGDGHWPSLASNQKQTDSLQNSFLVPIYHRKFRRTFERNLVINRLSVKLSFGTYLSFLSWSELLKQSLVFWTQYSPFWYLIYHFEFELNFRNKTWFLGKHSQWNLVPIFLLVPNQVTHLKGCQKMGMCYVPFQIKKFSWTFLQGQLWCPDTCQ